MGHEGIVGVDVDGTLLEDASLAFAFSFSAAMAPLEALAFGPSST